MTTRLHPFDWEKLQKGMWIETDELEEAARCKRTDPSFQLRLLGLRQAIEARTGILSREDGQRLRLMTDSEAQIWNLREAGRASMKLERCARRHAENIDPSLLSSTERTVHEHAVRTLGAMAHAQRVERERNAALFALLPPAKQLPDR